jgi:DNA polymerase III subunit alpha
VELEYELGVISNAKARLRRLLPDHAGLHQLGEGARDPGGSGPRLGGGLARGLRAWASPTSDPLEFDLLFERFLNPDRVSMPDIDIDFCYERRGEVIEYVREKYGKDSVGQIITFGTMKSRAVIRTSAACSASSRRRRTGWRS